MIKTVTIIPTFVFDPTILTKVDAQTEIWYQDGKHTNNVNKFQDDRGQLTIERWNWINEDAATDYKNFILTNFSETYPGLTVDIVTN